MARIAGVDLPNKYTQIALTYIFGVGRSTADQLCRKHNIPETKRINDLSPDELNLLRREVEDHYRVEGRLRSEIALNIKRLKDIGCYRGLRHRKGLPVNGQRTKTNARTRKGRAKTVANKKK